MTTEQQTSRHLAVQFADLAKQTHAARLAMWIFLGSELLLFAALFALYAAYRSEYPRAFAEGVHHNALALGTTNTVVLIVSSFTVAWSVHALRRARRTTALAMLACTLLLGATFLAIKGIEYADHIAHGIVPGGTYANAPAGTSLFFTLYYLMTGLHAIHMIGGLIVMGWLAGRVRRNRLTAAGSTTTSAHPTELELGALYWHLVDSIWIFLWPLYYLTG